jgi:hypothetical protein
MPWRGSPYDADAGCHASASVTLDCCAAPLGSACTSPTAPGCVTDGDGGLWWVAGIWWTDRYPQCDAAIYLDVANSRACPP